MFQQQFCELKVNHFDLGNKWFRPMNIWIMRGFAVITLNFTLSSSVDSLINWFRYRLANFCWIVFNEELINWERSELDCVKWNVFITFLWYISRIEKVFYLQKATIIKVIPLRLMSKKSLISFNCYINQDVKTQGFTSNITISPYKGPTEQQKPKAVYESIFTVLRRCL